MAHRLGIRVVVGIVVVALTAVSGCDVRNVNTSEGDYVLADVWTPAAAPAASEATVYTYSTVGTPQQMSVYLPSGAGGPRPTIVYVHGGGFFTGSRDELVTSPWYIGASMIAQLRRGWIVVSVDYRLTYQGEGTAAVDDIRAAVSYAKGLSDIGGTDMDVDPAKVVLAGSSAGGNLALLAGLDPDPNSAVKGVVSLDGPSDLATLHDAALRDATFLSSSQLTALNTATMTAPEKDMFRLKYGYNLTLPAPTPPVSVVEAGEIVPAYTGCGRDLTKDSCPLLTSLSALSHVSAESPKVYLACANTGPAPYTSFCPDARKMERAYATAHALAGDPEDPDEQKTFAWVDPLESANHYNVDRYVNLRMLEAFLDDIT